MYKIPQCLRIGEHCLTFQRAYWNDDYEHLSFVYSCRGGCCTAPGCGITIEIGEKSLLDGDLSEFVRERSNFGEEEDDKD